MVVIKMENGMQVFRVRGNDRCEKYECKNNPLTVTGVKEKKDKFYEVVTSCDLCGEIYTFTRMNRRCVK